MSRTRLPDPFLQKAYNITRIFVKPGEKVVMRRGHDASVTAQASYRMKITPKREGDAGFRVWQWLSP